MQEIVISLVVLGCQNQVRLPLGLVPRLPILAWCEIALRIP